MKTLSIYAAFIISIFTINISLAQKTDVLNTKEKIKVWGNCDMCKKKIEGAALAAGAAKATWSYETGILNVSYDGAKTSSQKIQQAIARSGYDTQDQKAVDESYSKLPPCCRYERNTLLNTADMKHNCKMECCKDVATCNKDKCVDTGCKTMACCKS